MTAAIGCSFAQPGFRPSLFQSANLDRYRERYVQTSAQARLRRIHLSHLVVELFEGALDVVGLDGLDVGHEGLQWGQQGDDFRLRVALGGGHQRLDDGVGVVVVGEVVAVDEVGAELGDNLLGVGDGGGRDRAELELRSELDEGHKRRPELVETRVLLELRGLAREPLEVVGVLIKREVSEQRDGLGVSRRVAVLGERVDEGQTVAQTVHLGRLD